MLRCRHPGSSTQGMIAPESRQGAADCPIGNVATACKVAADCKSASQLTSLAGTTASPSVGHPHGFLHTSLNLMPSDPM